MSYRVHKRGKDERLFLRLGQVLANITGRIQVVWYDDVRKMWRVNDEDFIMHHVPKNKWCAVKFPERINKAEWKDARVSYRGG